MKGHAPPNMTPRILAPLLRCRSSLQKRMSFKEAACPGKSSGPCQTALPLRSRDTPHSPECRSLLIPASDPASPIFLSIAPLAICRQLKDVGHTPDSGGIIIESLRFSIARNRSIDRLYLLLNRRLTMRSRSIDDSCCTRDYKLLYLLNLQIKMDLPFRRIWDRE